MPVTLYMRRRGEHLRCVDAAGAEALSDVPTDAIVRVDIRRPRNVRDTQLKKHYGITLADWEAMYLAQGGVCAVCKATETDKSSRYANLAVDHCHTTGKVRGLLCNACNRAIGFLRDDPQIARALAAYLEGA